MQKFVNHFRLGCVSNSGLTFFKYSTRCYLSNRSYFQEIFEGEMLIPNIYIVLPIPLQIFLQCTLYSKVTFKSIIGPDDICLCDLHAGMNGLTLDHMPYIKDHTLTKSDFTHMPALFSKSLVLNKHISPNHA